MFKKSKISDARIGKIKTPHGEINTPFFMPVATKGSIKSLSSFDMKDLESQILLSNTYHLLIKPGPEVIKKHKGLHNFMNWQGPILTDSGGFQVFSLSRINKISDNGVEFQSPYDGSKIFLSPTRSLEFQKLLGSDICMLFDECPPYTKDKKVVERAVMRTTKWAKEQKNLTKEWKNKPLIFCIIQGGIFDDLREKSLEEITKLDFDGYAVGGMAIGEPEEEMFKTLNNITSKMPDDKPRYLMGIGEPSQMLQAVKLGVDMFDCVMPTRHARHGEMFILGKNFSYKKIDIKKKIFEKDLSPIDKNCKCLTCQNYTTSYIHHLYRAKELLYYRLSTIHNIAFYMNWMKNIREGIKNGKI